MASSTIIKRLDRYVGKHLAHWFAQTSRDPIMRMPKHIAVIRLWAIGESLLALPAIAALKAQWPAIVIGQIASLAWLTLCGDGKVIWKAKYDALKGLPKILRAA